MKARLLLVDDNEDNLFSTKILLERAGYRVDTVKSGAQAVERIRAGQRGYALVLMDYDMPEMNGAQAILEIHAIHPKQQIAIHTCHDDRDVVKDSLRSGSVDFLEKQMDPELLLIRIEELCEKYDRTCKPILSAAEAGEVEKPIASVGLVGRSVSLGVTAANTVTFAPQPQTVLIHGESGTGKELIAQALHRLSPRKNASFVAVNCAAIPENLLESVLFGHERGSFTGAVKNQVGKFVLANHGTLFLDEIGDMPLPLQAKLLRVLQESEVEPVGASKPVRIDVRIVAASHRNLAERAAQGLFREDLLYRLKVLEIEIAPLRDRVEDIEPLVAHFTEAWSKKAGIQKNFERATLPILNAYGWPGNVRELEHVVERHLVMAPGGSVGVEDLDGKLFRSKPIQSLKDLEGRHREEVKDFIGKTLARAQSKSEAARKMGISPSHLTYYLKSYQITA